MPLPPRRRIPLRAEPAAPDSQPVIGVSRRAALQGLAGSFGAVFAATSGESAEAHPVGAHVVQRSQAKTGAKAPRAAAPAFLDAHQFATLAVVADLIVPGAVASESHRFIDDVLAVERPEVQRRFVSALGAIDAAARERHARAFRELPRDRQVALLEEAARSKSTPPDPAPKEPEDSAARNEAMPRVNGLRAPFDHLKTWIAGAHYSSEAGMKELGWTGGMFFASFPGCTHPGGHE